MRRKIGSVHSARRQTGGRYETTAMLLSTLGILVTMALGVLMMPLASDAQQPGKVPRIGYLWSGTGSIGAPRLEAFRHGLRDLGYV